MQHRTLDQLGPVANVLAAAAESGRLLRRRRLERLAEILESHPEPVQLFRDIEYVPATGRPSLRQDGSPFSVAFQDPLLRGQGLASDTIGDAMTFFDLSWRETHYLVCYCHYGNQARSGAVAERVRHLASQRSWAERWDAFRTAIAARFARAS
jgi:hypothetical protein